MEILKNKSLKETLKTLINFGYEAIFMFEKGKLLNPSTNKKYHPTDCLLMGYATFDEKECPNNTPCTLYLLKCTDGTKGSLLFNKNNNIDALLNAFIKRLILEFKA